MTRVVMLIHEERGTYGASFPDFPGAVTTADDLDALIPKAAEMLAFHVAGMVADGEPLPAIRTPGQVLTDPALAEDRADAIPWLLEVDLPARTVRVNITLDEGMLRRIDRAAESVGESRSGFLVSAARDRLAGLAAARG